MMKIKDLTKWLEAREKSMCCDFKKIDAPCGSHPEKYLQFYAIDETVASRSEEINTNFVVALGSNYTQIRKDERISEPFSVQQGIGRWRNNAKHAIEVLSENIWSDYWVCHKWASKPVTNLPNDFIFIMTNLCPWITTKSWSQLSRRNADCLLEKSKEDQKYIHVDSLLAYLKKSNCKITLIGHGINDLIREPLLKYLGDQAGVDWFLYANLTYKISPKCWDTSEKRFKFSSRAICI